MKMFNKLIALAAVVTAPAHAACTANQPDAGSMQGAWLAQAGPNVMHIMNLKDYSEVDEVIYFSTSENTLSGEWSLSRKQASDEFSPARFYLQIRQRSGYVNKNQILSFDCNQLMLKDQYGKVRTYSRMGPNVVAQQPAPVVTSSPSAGNDTATPSKRPMTPDEARAAYKALNPSQRAAVRALSPEQQRQLMNRQ